MDNIDNRNEESVSEAGILNAARDVFMEKGMAGARMQEIADRAGINKAMLHYYFRSKEKLFDRVFVEAFKEFWPRVEEALLIDSPYQAIDSIIEAYLKTFTQKPYLPNFILSELHRSPDRFEGLMKETGVNPQLIVAFLSRLMENGFLKQVDPREMMVNVLSLCIFPFAARPLMIRLLMANDEQEWEHFIQGRKRSIMNVVEQCYLIKPE